MIQLVCFGRMKQAQKQSLQPLLDEYLKRCRRWQAIELVELVESGLSKGDTLLAQKEEAEQLALYIAKAQQCLVFSERGSSYTSETWASFLQEQNDCHGFCKQKPWLWVIGGPSGLHPEVEACAQTSVCLSRMTFPHLLARVMILEQLYRGLCIQHHVPYHK